MSIVTYTLRLLKKNSLYQWNKKIKIVIFFFWFWVSQKIGSQTWLSRGDVMYRQVPTKCAAELQIWPLGTLNQRGWPWLPCTDTNSRLCTAKGQACPQKRWVCAMPPGGSVTDLRKAPALEPQVPTVKPREDAWFPCVLLAKPMGFAWLPRGVCVGGCAGSKTEGGCCVQYSHFTQCNSLLLKILFAK